MPTFYLEILSASAPFAASLDDNSRTVFSINFYTCARAPVVDFKNEIMALITDAGLGTRGTDMGVGRFWKVPIGDGPFVTVIETAGLSPEETHDGAKYERRSFQILVTAQVYSDAETRANAIWRALDGVRNTEVTGL